MFSFNGAWLLLVEGGGPTSDKPDVEFVPPDPERASHSFTIRVPDCRAGYETLKERGAEFLTPPYDWGQRSDASSAIPMAICSKSAR